MKSFRLFFAALFAFTVIAHAPGQDTDEFQSLHAKAEKGNGIAQYNLGLAYAEGRGVPADRLEAFVWLSLARQNGARGRALDNLVASFDKATFEAAQKRLTERRASVGTQVISVPEPAPAKPLPAPTPVVSQKITPASPPAVTSDTAVPSDQIATLIADKKQLSGEVAQAWKELDQLKAELDKNKKQTLSVATDLARTRQALVTAQQAAKPAVDPAALDKTSHELQAAKAEVESLNKFGRELEASLGRLNDEKTALQTQLAAAQASASQLAPLQTDLARLKSELADRTQKDGGQVQALTAQLADTQQKLAEAQTKAAASGQTATQLKSTEAELAQLRTAREQLTANVQKLVDDKAGLEKKVAANDANAAHVRELEASLASLQSAAKTSATAQTSLAAVATAKSAASDKQIAGLQSEISSAKTQITTLTADRDAARQAQHELGTALAKLEQEKSRLVAAQIPSAETTRQLKELTDKSTAGEKQLATVRQEKEALTAKLAESATETSRLKDDRERMQKLLADSGKQLRDAASGSARAKELENQNAKLQTAVAKLEEDKVRLSSAPTFPDLSGRVGELEAKLVTANQKNDSLVQASAAANKQSMADLSASAAQLVHLQNELAARSAAPAYPDLSGQVHDLEAQLTAAEKKSSATAQASTSDLKASAAKVAQLEAALTDARKPVAPTYPDLSGKVRELETKIADTTKQLAAASLTLSEQQKQLSETKATVQAATKAKGDEAQARRERDDLSSKLAALTSETTQLRSDRERMQKLIADAGKQQRDSAADATRIKSLESQVTGLQASVAAKPATPSYPDLSGKVRELEISLAEARKPVTPPYPDLTAKVRELDTQLADAARTATESNRQKTAAAANVAKLEADLAEARRPVAPAYPDLSAKVGELEGKLVAANQKVESVTQASANSSKQIMADLSASAAQIVHLQSQLAAKPDAPAYPDLSGKVHDLETQLAATEKKSAAAAQAATSDLKTSGTKIVQLEAALAEARKPVAPAYPDLSAKVHDLEIQLASAEKKSSTAAQASSSDLKASATKVAQLEAALTEARKPVAPAYPDLSGKVHDLETQLATAEKKSSVAAQSSTSDLKASGAKVAQLEAALAEARKPVAPAYPDLAEKVSELQGKLALAEKAAARPAAPSYPDLSSRVRELETAIAESSKQAVASGTAQAQLQKQLADSAAALRTEKARHDDAPLRRERDDLSTRLASLTSETAQLRSDRERMQKLLADSGKQLRDSTSDAAQIKELETKSISLQTSLAAAQSQVTSLQASLAAQPAAPSYPDLSGRVTELETKLATVNRQAESAVQIAANVSKQSTGDLNAASAQIAQLQSALAAKSTAPVYPDLSDKVRDLEKQAIIINERFAVANESGKRSAADLGTATTKITELETALTEARKPVAPAYPDLSDKVRELQGQLATAEKAVAEKPAAPAYPDLSGKLRELQNQLTVTNERAVNAAEAGKRTATDLTAATARAAKLETALAEARKPVAPAYPNLSDKVRELQAQLASAERAVSEKPAAPAYPNLSARVQELEEQLAAVPKTRAPVYPNLAGRVSELQTALADAKRDLADTQASLRTAEQARSVAAVPVAAPAPASDGNGDDLKKQLAATEDKLATALKGYALLQREHETQAAGVAKSTADLAAERDKLAGQVAALTGDVDQLKTSVANQNGTAQTEVARLNESLAALQRSSSKNASDLAAERVLLQQMQGSNTVLATENYQLKTRLGIAASAPTQTPVAPVAVTTTSAAAPRTHIVAVGESLSKISQRYYGTPTRWQEIFRANRDKIGNSGVLRVGLELRIP